MYSAAAPATVGVAMEVPDIQAQRLPRKVDRMHLPGAMMSTSAP